jgi:hypothetical protein
MTVRLSWDRIGGIGVPLDEDPVLRGAQAHTATGVEILQIHYRGPRASATTRPPNISIAMRSSVSSMRLAHAPQ